MNEERVAPTRYSPPPIETSASEETLDKFALAIGRGPQVGRLMWCGLSDAVDLWASVEEYILFARQRGDQAPFFPATRVTKYIAHKAIKQYKEAGKVDERTLKDAERAIQRFHSALGLPWDEVEARATALVRRGALEAWGGVEAHSHDHDSEDLGGMF